MHTHRRRDAEVKFFRLHAPSRHVSFQGPVAGVFRPLFSFSPPPPPPALSLSPKQETTGNLLIGDSVAQGSLRILKKLEHYKETLDLIEVTCQGKAFFSLMDSFCGIVVTLYQVRLSPFLLFTIMISGSFIGLIVYGYKIS